VGAKYTKRDFASDEIAMAPPSGASNKMEYEAKRDRWNGFDPSTYKFTIEEWN
jgi:pre-mRNA-processing factor SLU7